MINLQPEAIQVKSKGINTDNASTLNSGANGAQVNEFSDLLGISVSQLETPDTAALTESTCASAECGTATTGQDLPLLDENLPLADGLNIPGLTPLSAAEGEELFTQNNTSQLPFSESDYIDEQGIADLAAESESELSGGREVKLPIDAEIILSSEGEPVQAPGLELTPIIPVSPEIAANLVETVTDKSAKNTALDAKILTAQSLTSSPVAMFTQGQGSGNQTSMENTNQPVLPVADLQLTQSDSKQDFSQILDKAPIALTKEGAMTETVLLANKATGSIIKTPTETFQLHQPINKPGWSEEFGNRLVWLSKEGVQEAKIRLTPANLGMIEIKISVENDQAKVSFLSQSSAVRDVIEGSLPRLREMMQESGVKLENVNVGSQPNTSDNKQQSHLHHEQNENRPFRNAAQNQDLDDMNGNELLISMGDSSMEGVDYFV
ncbi:MAG: hypothetical protein GXP13_02850 [Gammaproteobacteria bacterium]|nr:hypothetical protein [Gammaproteobacteria bacterium]